MRVLLPPTLMRSSRLSEWLLSSEKISESSWNVRKLSLLRGKQGEKSATLPRWGFLFGLSSPHPNDPSYAQLQLGLAVWEPFQSVSHRRVR